MIYYAMASFTNLRIICSETLNVSLNPIPQPKEWLRWASTPMLKQKQHQKQKKNMFSHNFQFAAVFKLPCYVFSQKSTYSCACKLEISGNSNLQPAFTRCGLEALADNLVLMWNWTALSSAPTPQEQNRDTHCFFPSVISGVFTSTSKELHALEQRWANFFAGHMTDLR